jgi:hypothetical protein
MNLTAPIKIDKPKTKYYKYLSINALKNKSDLVKLSFEQFDELQAKDPKKYDDILKKAGIGMDTITYCDYVDMSDCNTILDTLILNINSLDVLKKVMKTTILPFSSQYVNDIDINYNNFNSVLLNNCC